RFCSGMAAPGDPTNPKPFSRRGVDRMNRHWHRSLSEFLHHEPMQNVPSEANPAEKPQQEHESPLIAEQETDALSASLPTSAACLTDEQSLAYVLQTLDVN